MSTATVTTRAIPLFPQTEFNNLKGNNQTTNESILDIAKKTFDPSDKKTAVSLFKRANDAQSTIHRDRLNAAAGSVFDPYKQNSHKRIKQK